MIVKDIFLLPKITSNMNPFLYFEINFEIMGLFPLPSLSTHPLYYMFLMLLAL